MAAGDSSRSDTLTSTLCPAPNARRAAAAHNASEAPHEEFAINATKAIRIGGYSADPPRPPTAHLSQQLHICHPCRPMLSMEPPLSRSAYEPAAGCAMHPSSFLFKTTSVSAAPAATRDVAAIAIGNLRL